MKSSSLIKNKFYVYRHIRLDKNVPFYVGKGFAKRAFQKANRNQYHRNIQKITPIKIEIVKFFETEEEAYSFEYKLITLYKSFGYCVANFATGGKGGFSGVYHDNTGSKNPMFGKKHGESTKQLIRELALKRLAVPENNPMFGKRGHLNPKFGKKCAKQTEALLGRTGRNSPEFQGLWHCGEFGIYESSSLAAKAIGIHKSTIKQRVRYTSEKWKNWYFERLNLPHGKALKKEVI